MKNNSVYLLRNNLVQLSSIKSLLVVFFEIFQNQFHFFLTALNVVDGFQNLCFVLFQIINFLSNNFFNNFAQLNTYGLFNNLGIVGLINHLRNFLWHSILDSLLYFLSKFLCFLAALLNLREFSFSIWFLLVLHFTFIIYIKW